MKIETQNDINFTLTVVPRKYEYSGVVAVTIRECINNTIISVTASATDVKGLFRVDLSDFIPVNDTKYEFTIKTTSDEVIWFGQELYTIKDVQNYQLNNSDENKLRF